MDGAILCPACQKIFADGALDNFSQSDHLTCLLTSPGPVFCMRHRRVLHADWTSYCHAVELGCFVCCGLQALRLTSSAAQPFQVLYHLVGWRDIPDAPQGFLCVLSVYIPNNTEFCVNVRIEPSPAEALDACIITQARRSRTARATNDDRVLDLARTWLEQCQCSHELCRAPSETFMPRRLLHLSSSRAQLVEYSKHEVFPYVTLSHCWGLQPFFTLTSDSYDTLCQGLSFDSFKPTFRDAMQVVRELGFEHLWIDCYCIIQGNSSTAVQDWKEQSVLMHQVYANAVVNLGATRGAGPDDGLFASFDRPRPPVEVDRRFVSNGGGKWLMTDALYWQPFSAQPGQMMRLISMPEYLTQAHATLPTLLTRGWVVQERVLARRMLHFAADGIVWECATYYQANEWEPWGATKTYQNDISSGAVHSGGASTKREHVHMWAQVLQAYTATQLTYPDKDKLMAIEGIGRRLAALGGDTYSFGFLHSSLPSALCWEAVRPRRTDDSAYSVIREPRPYQAPSWHWASGTSRRTFYKLYKHEHEHRRRLPLLKTLDVEGLYATEMRAYTPLFCVGRLILVQLVWELDVSSPYLEWGPQHTSFATGLEGAPWLRYDMPLTERDVNPRSGDVFALPVWYEVRGGLKVEGAPLRRLFSHCRYIRTGTGSEHLADDGLYDTSATEDGYDPQTSATPDEHTFGVGGLVLQRTSPFTFKRLGTYEVQQPLPSAHHVYAMIMARAQLICII